MFRVHMSPRKHGGVLLLFSFLSLLTTWPLATHITTHVPGNGIDDPSLAWNLWWVKHRLVEQLNWDIFHSDWMFYPVEINLAFYTLTPLNGLISTPLQFASSLIVTSNLLLLSSFVIGGYGTYLLCYWLLLTTRPYKIRGATLCLQDAAWIAAVFGGVVYAFASAKLFYVALGQFNIASSHWVPFCILYLLRIFQPNSVDSSASHSSGSYSSGFYSSGSYSTSSVSSTNGSRWRNTALCALFLIFQAWAELTYASFLVIFIVNYAGWVLIAQVARPTGRTISAIISTVLPFVSLAFLFLLGISPFLAAMIPDMLTEGDFFQSGGGFADWFSADLVGYLVPTRLHPLFGDWVGGLHQRGFSNDVGQHIYLGYTLLVLIVLGLVGMQRLKNHEPSRSSQTVQFATTGSRPFRVGAWFWLANLVLFWLLTLGPNPRWFGQPLPVPGPFAFVSQLPIFSGNRYPSRYAIMLLLVAAVLAAYGLCWLLQNRPFSKRPVLVSLLIGALFFAEHVSAPLPINLSTTPAIYQKIAETPGDFTVLELPTGWRNGAYVLGKSDKLIMMQQWYQSIHGKRRLGGNTSRNPWYKFEYFVNAPVLGDLVALMNGAQPHFVAEISEQKDVFFARSQKDGLAVLDFLDVEYVTVRVEKSSPALLELVDQALPLMLVGEWEGTDWDGEQETIKLYQVDRSHSLDVENERHYNLAGELGPLYSAEGWSVLTNEGFRFALRRRVDLLLDLPETEGILEVDWRINRPTIAVNGVSLPAVDRAEANNDPQNTDLTDRFRLPEDIANQPVDRVSLMFGVDPAPYSALHSLEPNESWPVGNTGATISSNSAILVMSAGAESGKFARIYINGVNQIGGQRGYHLVAISPDGYILGVELFDTIADLAESPRMVAWLGQWPEGTIIAGAASDAVDSHEGTMLSDMVIDALAQLGVAESMQGRHRWAHAFVGAVGAPPDSAVESAQLFGVSAVHVGSVLDGDYAYGAVSEVRFVE